MSLQVDVVASILIDIGNITVKEPYRPSMVTEYVPVSPLVTLKVTSLLSPAARVTLLVSSSAPLIFKTTS